MADLPRNLVQVINDDYLVADISLRILSREADDRITIEGTYKIYDGIYGLTKGYIQSQVSEFGGIPADNPDAGNLLSMLFIHQAFYGLMDKQAQKETINEAMWKSVEENALTPREGRIPENRVYNLRDFCEYARLLGYTKQVSKIKDILHQLRYLE